VQPIVERIVVNAIKPNLLSTGEGVQKYLQANARCG
jgi:hypothetical protein